MAEPAPEIAAQGPWFDTPAFWRGVLRAISWFYLAGLVLLWGWTRAVAEESPEATLLLYAPQALYGLPLPVLGAWSLLRRDPSALVAQGLALGWIAGPLMGLCLPLAGGWAAGAGKPSLRVMSYNVHVVRAGAGPIRGEVRAARPDLLLLVEAWNEHRNEKLYDRLPQDLPGYAIYQQNEYYLASRYPLEGPGLVMNGASEVEGVTAVVAAPFGRFRVIGTHLPKDRVFAPVWSCLSRSAPGEVEAGFEPVEKRERDLRHLLAARQPGEPLVLLGDFNLPPAGRLYDHLAVGLQDAFGAAGVGWGCTFPARLPLIRIDHVFASDHWTPRHCWVGGGRGSHHRPVIAELAWTGAGR
jgi:vancomycin resistance protein VanJ